MKLRREIREVETKWGAVKVKFSEGAGVHTVTPEYDDCRRISLERGVPLKTVMEDVRAAASSSRPGLEAHDDHAAKHSHHH